MSKLEAPKPCPFCGGRSIIDVCMDIIVEPKIHDLTLEEIEKKLGYKVRIVADTKGE